MITNTISVFPNNAVFHISTRLQSLDSDLFVARRPLRSSDPVQSIGVYAISWQPNEESYEMKGALPSIHEPTLQRYLIGIQAFVKDMDEENGLIVHAVLSKLVRTMLYRDEPLRVLLRSLSVLLTGSTERTQRFGISSQRFVGNEIGGAFLYLSTLELWLETETT